MSPISAEPIALAYLGLFLVSAVVCLAAIPRARSFDDPAISRGLSWLLGLTGVWGLFKTAYFLLPHPFNEASYLLGLVAGFGTVWAWLYFASAYTGRSLHENSTLRRLSGAVFVAVVLAKLTNPVHGSYFTSEPSSVPFQHLAINHGALHWTATGLSYVLAAIGLFMLFELYVQAEYDTRPLGLLAAMLALPITFDLVAISTPQLINFIYAPIGVAIFALGVLFVFQERLLAIKTTAASETASVFLDDDRRIRDATPAATALFPELKTGIGEPLEAVLPTVVQLLDNGDRVLELHDNAEPQYYLLGATSIGVEHSAARVLTFTDITELERQRRELKRQERELNRRNELYRAIVAASFAFVYRSDLTGEITFVSPGVEDVLGYNPTDIEGKTAAMLAANEQAADRTRQHFSDVANGEALQVSDFPLEDSTGQTIYVDFRVVPIYDPDVPVDERTPANIVGAQGMAREATERRQRESLISVINRVLRHNVRNELTVINGYAEMLTEELDDERAAQAERILDTGDRLLDLTESAQQIEDLRGESAELAPHDVVPLIADAVEQVDRQYPAASVSVTAPDSAVALTQPRLETAIWELLDNAADHSGAAPSITVDVAVDPNRITVTIADDGPGLPETERDVLASGSEEPLVHSDGLGLWLAHWIVTTLDGEMRVPSIDGGTTVELTLPRPES